MSVIVSRLAYRHANRQVLFEGIGFSVPAGRKVAVVGNNGSGKSTLLRILAGELSPAAGTVWCSTLPYYIPQQIGETGQNIAEALDVAEKIKALNAIENGSTDTRHFDALADDWDVEVRCRTALSHWGLAEVGLDTSLERLSGGERTKVYLAGLLVHAPEIMFMDEPTNHLDAATRTKLYDYAAASKATMIIVSHDVTLLGQIDATYELSEKGLRPYGGNYDFYRQQKCQEDSALAQQIDAEEAALKQARRKALEVRERQQRRDSRAGKISSGVPRIILNARHDKGENTGAKLAEKHAGIISESRQKLTELRGRQRRNATLKIDFDDAELHDGKLLVVARSVNFGYGSTSETWAGANAGSDAGVGASENAGADAANCKKLWPMPLNLEIRSGERIHIIGDNGSGKTTLIKLLTGTLTPTAGEVRRTDNFSYLYLDQQYSQVCRNISVLELAQEHNLENLPDHDVKIRLNRALFPVETWDKNCLALSGGERMRLCLCCLMLLNHIPDMLILDEPTNNLDLASLAILTDMVRNYRGTLVVISHDRHFVEEVGLTKVIELRACLNLTTFDGFNPQ